MKSFFIFFVVLFAVEVNAQKAFDKVLYKGKWENFNINLHYAYGYTEATELISIHKKTGDRKVYRFNRYDKERLILANTKNKTTFSLFILDTEDQLPRLTTITISFNGTKEDFVVERK